MYSSDYMVKNLSILWIVFMTFISRDTMKNKKFSMFALHIAFLNTVFKVIFGPIE